MLVKYRMTPNPMTISPNLPIAEALEQMRQKKVRRFPVVDKKGEMVGIVTDQDLLYASPSSVTSLNVWEVTYLLNQIQVREVMTKKVLTVEEDCPIEEAARLMCENKVGGLPVTRDGSLVGIITESDIFKVFLEIFMAQEEGVRLTVEAPYVKGSMAQISSAITAKGGLIHSLNSFVAEDPQSWGCILKVADISQEDLVAAVQPLVTEILDVREMPGPSSRAC
jgi:acetoin utilization protein AcuB